MKGCLNLGKVKGNLGACLGFEIKKLDGTIKHVYSNYGSWGGVEGVTKKGSRGLVHHFVLEGDTCRYGGANFCKLICN